MNKQTKQLAIIGVLAAVLLAVGAFQFMTPVPVPPLPDQEKTAAAPGSEPVEPAANGEAPTAETAKSDPIRDALLNYATSNATPRDPFKPAGDLAKEFASPQGKVAPAEASPVVGNAAEGANPGPSRFPRQNVEPMNPMQGSLAGGPGVGLMQSGSLPDGSNSADPRIITGGPSYKVKGILVGTTRMVVLEDAEGNQKLVPEGGSVDGDTTIVKVQNNTVKISTRGKRKEVPLEEEHR